MTDDEARDIEDEATYWRKRRAEGGPNCLWTLLMVLGVAVGLPLWAALT